MKIISVTTGALLVMATAHISLALLVAFLVRRIYAEAVDEQAHTKNDQSSLLQFRDQARVMLTSLGMDIIHSMRSDMKGFLKVSVHDVHPRCRLSRSGGGSLTPCIRRHIAATDEM